MGVVYLIDFVPDWLKENLFVILLLVFLQVVIAKLLFISEMISDIIVFIFLVLENPILKHVQKHEYFYHSLDFLALI